MILLCKFEKSLSLIVYIVQSLGVQKVSQPVSKEQLLSYQVQGV